MQSIVHSKLNRSCIWISTSLFMCQGFLKVFLIDTGLELMSGCGIYVQVITYYAAAIGKQLWILYCQHDLYTLAIVVCRQHEIIREITVGLLSLYKRYSTGIPCSSDGCGLSERPSPVHQLTGLEVICKVVGREGRGRSTLDKQLCHLRLVL